MTYRTIFGRVIPLEGFYSFPLFFLSAYRYSFDTLLCHTKIQIKFEFGFDPLNFPEVMALGLKKNITNYQFSALFSLCLQILI
jgi:hypothetical protein